MIQWYPGHMAKAIKEINEKVKLCDLVIVLLDARIPQSSFNPLLKENLRNKKTLYVFTKKDKAETELTNYWLNYYKSNDADSLAIDGRTKQGASLIEKKAQELLAEKREKDKKRGLKPRPIRTMIVGIPNVGKSTLINSLSGKKATNVGDKPGITKTQQWIKINPNLELLDTPGVLWQKFDDQEVGIKLAISGAIKDDIYPIDQVAYYFLNYLKKYHHEAFINRFGFEITDEVETLELLGKKLNYLLSNKEVNLDKTALSLLQDARLGYLGKITLDRADYETVQ